MSTIQDHSRARRQPARPVSPSLSTANSKPFSLDQELTPFGTWAGKPIWVPPKNASAEIAKTMLNQFGLFASKETCWSTMVHEYRSQFTQVREIEMSQASIRLPKGRLFVSVTERDQFDQITDTIPNCVRTRLEEFLAGPGKKPGVKVYYLKPLCVEVGDDLVFTTRDELHSAISKIQNEVFAEYRRRYLLDRSSKWMLGTADIALAVPKKVLKHFLNRKKRAIEAYHAKLEFIRRQETLRAVKLRQKFRTDECSFDDMLSMTNPPDRLDVIDQYVRENELSRRERERLIMASAITLPWFVTLSLGVYYASLAAVSLSTLTLAPPIILCDPAFVAEMPSSDGVVLKIGHFDEIRGVTHVEI